MPLGKIIFIRSVGNGMIVTSDGYQSPPNQWGLIANRTAVGGWERFLVIDRGNGNVAFQAQSNGKYVTADYGGNSPLIANRTAIGGWETFKWITLPNGDFALQAAANGKYVSADGYWNPQWTIVADRTAIGGWETFTWTISNTTSYYYTPVNVTDGIASHFFYDATYPKDASFIRTYSLGLVANTPMSWQVGDLTGLIVPPSVATTFQRGYQNTIGSTAVQLYGTGAGFYINSNYLEGGHPTAAEGYVGGAHVSYSWNKNEVQPWAELGKGARLRFQHDVKLTKWDSTKQGDECTAYYQGALIVATTDPVLGAPHEVDFQWTFGVWDSRHTHAESIHPDLPPSQMHQVDTYYATGTQYTTKESFSSNTNDSPAFDTTKRTYASYLTWDHVLSLISWYRSQFGVQLSIDPKDYWIGLISSGPEMYIAPTTGWCQFGTSLDNFYLLAYGP